MTPRGPVPHVTRPAPARSRLGRFVERLAAPFLLPIALLGALATLLATRAQATVIGVNVVTGSVPGPTDRAVIPGGTYFVAGLAERGDTVGVETVRSLAEYVEKLGSRVTYGALYDDLAAYFAEGGVEARVARVVGAAATKGTLTLNATTGGLPTIVLTAADPGAWSSTVTVQVLAGVVTDTRTLVVRLNGDIAEQYVDLGSPAAIVAAINARSGLLTAVDSGNATAAPGNLPAVIAATALSAGTDDRAAVVAATYTAALARFTPELGGGAVAIPGQAASAVGAGLIAHARAHNRLALTAPAAGSNAAAAKVEANGLRNTAGAEHAGIFYPHVTVPDGAGGTRTISPEGYVAAMRARAHRLAGPWRAPAGDVAIARYVLGVATTLTGADVDDLAGSRVNSIVTRAGAVRLYGWRSLSADSTNYVLLTGRDVLNFIAELGAVAAERVLFQPVDARGHLLASLAGELIGILDPIRLAGGLYERLDATGNVLDPGYTVDTGPSVNPPAALQANEVRAEVAVRISPNAELVTLTITKVAFDQDL